MADSSNSPPNRVVSGQAEAMLRAALASPLPRFYSNSFINAATDSDIMTVFQGNGQPICIMNYSYTTAKSFMIALKRIIDAYEERHKVEIPAVGIDMGPTSPNV